MQYSAYAFQLFRFAIETNRKGNIVHQNSKKRNQLLVMSIFENFQRFREEHEKLKKRIHAFRIPLSPVGQRVMGLVYFLIPIVTGCFVMQMAFKQAEVNIGRDGSLLRDTKENDGVDDKVRRQNEALNSVLQKVKNQK